MPESEPHPLFKALDTNNDGKLSLDELPELLRPAFERMDTNGDGFITPAEEAAARGAASEVAIEATPRQHFTTPLSVRGTSVAVPIPFDPNDTWGAKERHDVTGTINEHPIRGPLKADRDGFVLVLGPAWRRDAQLDLTADVEVELWPESPLVEELAADLRSALIANPEARAFFESISSFYRKNYVRWVEDAKQAETRAKRITECVSLLAARQLRR
jgi:Bacteriocin-protection, YdeI or OmpD-Associated/Domain of unknown function (DUF1905)/EF hand